MSGPKRYGGLLATAMILGACTAPVAEKSDPGRVGEIPATVAAIADPDQDLQSARLVPEDWCYWYQHVGPVETTLIPLRTVDGRPICARPPS